MKIKMNKKGFTLIELLIVVAIIAILAAIAIPQFSAYRLRAFNGAAQSDLRNAKTIEESVQAEYRGFGATQTGTTLNALAGPAISGGAAPGITGPLNPATGTVAGAAIATMIDAVGNDQVMETIVGFGLSVSNNVAVWGGPSSVAVAVGVGFADYRLLSKHRDGNRAFVTNISTAVCYAERTDNTWIGLLADGAVIGTWPVTGTGYDSPCNGDPSGGSPIATWVSL